MRDIYFYGTKKDLRSVFASVESQLSLSFVESNIYTQPPAIQSFSSLASLESLWACPTGDWNLDKSYLVLLPNHRVRVNAVPQLRGGIRYFVEQYLNQPSILIQPGGVHLDLAIVAGTLGGGYEDELSKGFFALYANALKRQCRKVKGRFIGSEAFDLWKSGYRLTMSVQCPKEIDLAVD